MNTRTAIVVNAQGYKVEFVAMQNVGDIETPMFYTLNNGESLVFEDINTALGMVKPRWNGSAWEETATPEEIEAARLTIRERRKPLEETVSELVETVQELKDEIVALRRLRV